MARTGARGTGWSGFGVTSTLRGTFPYPVVDYNSDNWDLLTFSQVNAVLCGSLRTHEYTDNYQTYAVNIDRCGSGIRRPGLRPG